RRSGYCRGRGDGGVRQGQGRGPRSVRGRGWSQGGGGGQAERVGRSQADGRGASRQGLRQPLRGLEHGDGEDPAVIAPMDQVTVVGRRSVVKDVLAALQFLGVVQVSRLAPYAEEHTLKG